METKLKTIFYVGKNVSQTAYSLLQYFFDENPNEGEIKVLNTQFDGVNVVINSYNSKLSEDFKIALNTFYRVNKECYSLMESKLNGVKTPETGLVEKIAQ